MTRHSLLLMTSIPLAIAFVATAAGDPAIDASKSSIIATFKEENVPVDAPLKKFNGRIDYNAAQPNAAKAALEVETGSLDMGTAEYNAEVRKKAWLDSATYPKATFVLSTPLRLPASALQGGVVDVSVTGVVTIHGTSRRLTIPLQMRLANTRIQAVGSLTFPWGEFNMIAPSVGGFVSVTDMATMEFDLDLKRA